MMPAIRKLDIPDLNPNVAGAFGIAGVEHGPRQPIEDEISRRIIVGVFADCVVAEIGGASFIDGNRRELDDLRLSGSRFVKLARAQCRPP